MDRVAAGVEPEIVARDLPPLADLVEQALGAEAIADQLPERLFDCVVARGEPGRGEFGRQCGGETAHPSGDVQRSGTGNGIGVAGGQ